MSVVAASRPRCLVVATGLTAALWGAAAVLVRSWAATAATGDGAVVRLCLVALLAAAGWAWVQGVAGVADAWRGAPARCPSGVRRWAVLACGLALSGALSGALSSALAAPARADGSNVAPDPLAGLPLPDRAAGPALRAHPTVVVHRGDTLWALAERELGARATGPEITAAWHALYRRNRGVIGPDPDLIRPGQVLALEHPHHVPKEQR